MLFRSGPAERRLRLALFESNYGRQGGWYVEREGRRLALLTEPRFEEMFWDSYRLEVLTDDPEERQRIPTDPAWWLQEGIAYRSRTFGVTAPAFPAGHVFTESGRVVLRGLHLFVGPPDLWEQILLWLRRRMTRRDTGDEAADRSQP